MTRQNRTWKMPRWTIALAIAAVTAAVFIVRSVQPEPTIAERFPDSALAACVTATLGEADARAEVGDAAISELQSLQCGNAAGGPQIKSLAGIERLTSLNSLDLSFHAVAELAPLAGLAYLGRLTLTGNTISDLGPLAGLPLTDLGLSGNRVDDLTPLAGTVTLQYLGLRDNPIVDITPLRALVALKELDISGARITDVAPLVGHGELNKLSLAGNRIVDLAPLSELPMSMLDLSNNRIADVATLGAPPWVQYLTIGGNPFTDVTALRRLPELLGVDLEGDDPAVLIGVEVLRAQGISVGGFA